MSTFWHWFVIVITVASMAGTLWLLFANAKGKPGEDTHHVWDEDLRELNNPLPRWWLNLFVLTVVFGAGYLVVYPGLGNFGGWFGWTQEAQMQAQLDRVREHRAGLYAQFRGKDLVQIAQDPAAQAIGRDLFLNNCAGCHGADARGAVGFPNLADHDWLYGGRPEDIVASIAQGRRGAMPLFLSALQPQQVDDIVTLVTRWSDPKLDPAVRARGLQQFGATCAACHGAEGRGNTMLGAPNLTDDIWLYGGDRERVRETVLFGRKGNMPAHETLLSPDDIRVVGAYVYGLARQTQVGAATEPSLGGP